jgi:hypothetical protein
MFPFNYHCQYLYVNQNSDPQTGIPRLEFVYYVVYTVDLYRSHMSTDLSNQLLYR